MKILAHAVLQYARLADVDDRPLFIEHDIHARGIGQQFEFFFQVAHLFLLYTFYPYFSRDCNGNFYKFGIIDNRKKNCYH